MSGDKTAKEGIFFRLMFFQLQQGTADSIPAGNVDPALAPAEDPWNGPQVCKRPLIRAPRGTGTNFACFNDINGCCLLKKADKILMTRQPVSYTHLRAH